MSTTLDTAAKVQAIYGGTWVAWGAGRVPVGVNTSDTDFNTVNKTGGSKTVTLPLDEHGGANLRTVGTNTYQGALSGVDVPKDGGGYYCFEHNGDYHTTAPSNWSGKGGIGLHGTTGSGDIMNPYVTVYMWRRSA